MGIGLISLEATLISEVLSNVNQKNNKMNIFVGTLFSFFATYGYIVNAVVTYYFCA